jgi:cobalt-precorrin 5A hydrolase/precorrin-3B C17-methyltransferase
VGTDTVTALSITVTERGRALARRLPFPSVHGEVAVTVRERWGAAEGLVLFVATGAAVRIIAPLLADKATDPAVVCVDEAGRFVVALCGGHAGGANNLARRVAALLGATAVVTTATDAVGTAGLDDLVGFTAHGDIAAVTAALLDGRPVLIDNERGWPLAAELASHRGGPSDPRIVITDSVVTDPGPGVVVLHPPSLVLGVGASSGAPVAEVAALVAGALADARLAPSAVAGVATIDLKAGEPAIVALGYPVRTFPAAVLGAVDVPTPSAAVAAAVGSPSVAEAAALAAAGPGATLVVAKRKSATATVAVARRAQPCGHLAVVGLGPGSAAHRTPAASAAVQSAEVVIGYGPYIDQCADALPTGAEVVRSPIGKECVRADQALAQAAAGRRVALVCSGDAGVYAMASLVFERAPRHPGLDAATGITVIPGVTASLAAAAVLGAPLGHDHVAISLSDLLTPWEIIVTRLEAAAAADLVVSLYNPRSGGRDWQLSDAQRILANHRPPSTPVGLVTDAGRTGERMTITTLADLDPTEVGMTTCVIIGSSTTRVAGGRMVTPRGYKTTRP